MLKKFNKLITESLINLDLEKYIIFQLKEEFERKGFEIDDDRITIPEPKDSKYSHGVPRYHAESELYNYVFEFSLSFEYKLKPIEVGMTIYCYKDKQKYIEFMETPQYESKYNELFNKLKKMEARKPWHEDFTGDKDNGGKEVDFSVIIYNVEDNTHEGRVMGSNNIRHKGGWVSNWSNLYDPSINTTEDLADYIIKIVRDRLDGGDGDDKPKPEGPKGDSIKKIQLVGV
jgi:hypothetical protein